MKLKSLLCRAGCAALLFLLGSCGVYHQSSKYNFNDGIYRTQRFSHDKVYVLKIDDDTMAVFPVTMFGDSTAIQVKQRVNYTSRQRKFKDNKIKHTFYRPSADIDVMTIPLKYHFPAGEMPNTFTTNFSGALYAGYRIDEYRVNYRRTPLNNYKQDIKHLGYSAGLFVGTGSGLINGTSLNDPNFAYEYEGVLLITGIAANVALDNVTVGVALGTDYLLDKNRREWIYEGRPYIGFTLGLNLN